MIRVLIIARGNLSSSLAGDTIQILKSAEELKRLGVDTEIRSDLPERLNDYDILHLFDISSAKETLRKARMAKDSGKVLILSPIYWNPEEFFLSNIEFPAVRSDYDRWRSSAEARRMIFDYVDAILPGTRSEDEAVRRDFGYRGRSFIVPCGVAGEFFAEASLRREHTVLSVARFTYRKNQLALIRALKRRRIRLILVGRVTNRSYYGMCRDEAYPEVEFIREMPHRSLARLYSSAKVHILPSWYEMPGLTSLEAAASGCNVVTTDRGSIGEYLGDKAFYCGPDSEESIIGAVIDALSVEGDPGLAEQIRMNYSWEIAAEKTLEAYKRLLA